MTKSSHPVIAWSLFEGGALDNIPDRHNGTWEDLAKLLSTVNPTPKAPDLASAKKLVPAFSETVFLQGTLRGKENAESIHLLVFDFDNCKEEPIPGEFHLDKRTGKPTTRPKLRKVPIETPANPEEVIEKLKAAGVAAVVYTTWSSSPALVKFRVAVPLQAPVSPMLWTPASEWAMDTLGLGQWRDSFAIDLPVLRDVARLNFLPCAPDPSSVRVWKLEGKHLSIPVDVLPAYEVRELVKQTWQKPRDKKDTTTGQEWFRDYKIDFATLDLEKLLKKMQLPMGTAKTYKKRDKDGKTKEGKKWRCHCLWPEEHSREIDKDDAAFSVFPGEWPTFWCEHTIHRGVIGLREVCEAAGKDLVESCGKPFAPAPSPSAPLPPPPPSAPPPSGPEVIHAVALEILTKHRGAGWTPKGQAAALRESVEYAIDLPEDFRPYLHALFWDVLGREIPISNETMQEHVLATRKKKDDAIHQMETRRHIEEIRNQVEEYLKDGKIPEARSHLLDEVAILRTNALRASRPAPKMVVDELGDLEEYLKKLRGRERLGLTQSTLPELDEALLGLRGLMLLAGPPGTGKTSLAVQLGLGALEADSEAAVILVSLEQGRFEHMTRNLAYFSHLPWKTVTMGSPVNPSKGWSEGVFFEPGDLKKLKDGERKLHIVGSRFQILDGLNYPEPTADSLLQEVAKIKEKTGASKVLVIVDYLQLWPVPPAVSKNIHTDLDRDKWQVGQLKSLKDNLGTEDAIVAISEATKADWKTGLTMGSIMGSARGAYSPDVVMVLQPFALEELAGDFQPTDEKKQKDEDKARKKREEGERIQKALQADGRSLIHLEIVKGRDGVHRCGIDLAFFFRELRFEETTLDRETADL